MSKKRKLSDKPKRRRSASVSLPPRDPKTGRFIATKPPAYGPRQRKPRKRVPRDPVTGRFYRPVLRLPAHPEFRMTAEQAIELYGFDALELPDWVVRGMQSGWLPATSPSLSATH
jgi:hypothetical protein